MPDGPPGLGWVEQFGESMTRANGAISLGPLAPSHDPLQWEVVLRLAPGHQWNSVMKGHAKTIFQIWARANECVYLRSRIDRQLLTITVVVRNPSRRQTTDPLEARDAPYRRR